MTSDNSAYLSYIPQKRRAAIAGRRFRVPHGYVSVVNILVQTMQYQLLRKSARSGKLCYNIFYPRGTRTQGAHAELAPF